MILFACFSLSLCFIRYRFCSVYSSMTNDAQPYTRAKWKFAYKTFTKWLVFSFLSCVRQTIISPWSECLSVGGEGEQREEQQQQQQEEEEGGVILPTFCWRSNGNRIYNANHQSTYIIYKNIVKQFGNSSGAVVDVGFVWISICNFGMWFSSCVFSDKLVLWSRVWHSQYINAINLFNEPNKWHFRFFCLFNVCWTIHLLLWHINQMMFSMNI